MVCYFLSLSYFPSLVIVWISFTCPWIASCVFCPCVFYLSGFSFSVFVPHVSSVFLPVFLLLFCSACTWFCSWMFCFLSFCCLPVFFFFVLFFYSFNQFLHLSHWFRSYFVTSDFPDNKREQKVKHQFSFILPRELFYSASLWNSAINQFHHKLEIWS